MPYASTTTLRITIAENPAEADRDAVLVPLRAYNAARAGDPRIIPVAIMLTGDCGDRVGGLWARCAFDWLFVELLFVPEEHRGAGWGRVLMEQAEGIARANKCLGIWLDSFEFQAPGFYKKLGFEVFGTLEDHPVGRQRYFFRKRF